MKTWIKYNINNYAKVKPTELGKKAYIKYWGDVIGEQTAAFNLKRDMDDDDFLIDQLWSLMSVFGGNMGGQLIDADQFYIEGNKLNV